MSSRYGATISLDRTETARVADAFEALAEVSGGRAAAAKRLDRGLEVYRQHCLRVASSRITMPLLARIAEAMGSTVENILAGRGPRPAGEAPQIGHRAAGRREAVRR